MLASTPACHWPARHGRLGTASAGKVGWKRHCCDSPGPVKLCRAPSHLESALLDPAPSQTTHHRSYPDPFLNPQIQCSIKLADQKTGEDLDPTNLRCRCRPVAGARALARTLACPRPCVLILCRAHLSSIHHQHPHLIFVAGCTQRGPAGWPPLALTVAALTLLLRWRPLEHRYKPRGSEGGGGMGGGIAPIGASAGALMAGGKVDWGYLAGNNKLVGAAATW